MYLILNLILIQFIMLVSFIQIILLVILFTSDAEIDYSFISLLDIYSNASFHPTNIVFRQSYRSL